MLKKKMVFILICLLLTSILLNPLLSTMKADDAVQEKNIILFFYRDGCNACEMQKPIVKQLKEKYSNFYDFIFYDVLEDNDMPYDYDIKLIPTTIITKNNGEIIEKIEGFQDIEYFIDLLDSNGENSDEKELSGSEYDISNEGFDTDYSDNSNNYIDYSVDEIFDLLKTDSDFVIIDIREEDDYLKYHIENAVSVPFSYFICSSCFEYNLAQYKNENIILYSQNGDNCDEAVDILIENDFNSVYKMYGGLDAWENYEYPIIYSDFKYDYTSNIDDLNKDLLLFFYSETCPFCIKQKPIIDLLESDYRDEISIARLDINKNSDFATDLNLVSIPTIFYLSNLDEEEISVMKISGFKDKYNLLKTIGLETEDKIKADDLLIDYKNPSELNDNVEIKSNLNVGTCNSCSSCNDLLSLGTYDVVRLIDNIDFWSGSCILSNYASNVVFDCDNHTIAGDNVPGVDDEDGIGFYHSTNVVVKNCRVIYFDRNIVFNNVENSKINNCKSLNGDYGILVKWSNNNEITENRAEYNSDGIFIEDSDSNVLESNIVCSNTDYDINQESGNYNNGYYNTCDITNSWDDYLETGCTYVCPDSVYCDSCTDCSNKLDGTYEKVILENDINNHAGNCIVFGADNVEFDGGGHTIDGDDFGLDYGVFIDNYDHNTVKNLHITDFNDGICLYGSNWNDISYVSSNSNINHGLKIFYSDNNEISNFLALYNYNNGIDLYYSDYNTFINAGAFYSLVGIRLDFSKNNDIAFGFYQNNDWGIYLYNSDYNNIRFNDITKNENGIKFDDGNFCELTHNKICSKYSKTDISIMSNSVGNHGDFNTCDNVINWIDDGRTSSGCSYRCSSCSDGIKNSDEEEVDCGGTYCPPCANCNTNAKYAPSDTGCTYAWPSLQGKYIDINTIGFQCDLIEVCDPNLDYIIEDALLCAENPNYELYLTEPRKQGKIAACRYAHKMAYKDNFEDYYNPTTQKTCVAHYIISSFGATGVYMQGYFHGELCCYKSSSCPSECRYFHVDPAAWEIGTIISCNGPGGHTTDFNMGGHVCEYKDSWIFGKHKKHGNWNSDTDYEKNSDSQADIPAHASINRLSTGTCVDYSIALTTILRKAGYSKDDVLSVHGKKHGYNLVKFPNEKKWHYVDTTGNSGSEIKGGAGYAGDPKKGYGWCYKLDGGCFNDVYGVSTKNCPKNSQIYGCSSEGSTGSNGYKTNEFIETNHETEENIRSNCDKINILATNESCTELNPCTVREVHVVETPPEPVDITLNKYMDDVNIYYGDTLEVIIEVTNNEDFPVEVVVKEIATSNIEYSGLIPFVEWYEGFSYEYYQWDLNIAPGLTEYVEFEMKPIKLGDFSFNPTYIYSSGVMYSIYSPVISVFCNPNGECEYGENYGYCPQDCPSGVEDGYCDSVSDDFFDPDCSYAEDPDYNPELDYDNDGVINNIDLCANTEPGSVVDINGCSCAQKKCEDDYSNTVDLCDSSTASCYYLLDSDEDGIADQDDNCVNIYNPGQEDSDSDGIGDQCEIPELDNDITLDPNTYHISDSDSNGAIRVTKSNVILDCNNAKIIGDGTGYGIYILENVTDITIQNCNVENYRYGIFIENSANNYVKYNKLKNNYFGIITVYTSTTTIEENEFISNTKAGIYLEKSNNFLIENNDITNSDAVGLFIHTSDSNEVQNNLICNSEEYDIYTYDSTNNGMNNICDSTHNWDDIGVAGCTYECEHIEPEINIVKPIKALYLFNTKIRDYILPRKPLIIGFIGIEAEILNDVDVEKVEFYIDEERKTTLFEEPYIWIWENKSYLKLNREITVIAYGNSGGIGQDQIAVLKIL